MRTILLTVSFSFLLFNSVNSQTCNPMGDQATYGVNNVWIGYVYNNMDFTSYKGYVTEGNAGSPDFDQNFGGDDVNYSTSGCSIQTNTFSVRYKLTKTFSSGVYEFTVGGDDGYRLSLDGGSTWVINRWFDQSYNVSTYVASLSGTYNMVLEFYENGGGNRISFNAAASCTGTENTTVYGTGDVWNGYVYDGTNFQIYKGMIHAGVAGNPAFDHNFGGSNTTFSTSGCTGVSTETFSVRYRLKKTLAAGSYTFFAGGDDGYRLSINGGATWIIDRWVLQSYNMTSYAVNLAAGTYDLVLEYYENGGDNRISFFMENATVLPVRLISFAGSLQNNRTVLDWKTAAGSNPAYFDIERSSDGNTFSGVGRVNVQASANSQADMLFTYTDVTAVTGKAWYRLKMTDLAGVATYSGVILITSAAVNTEALTLFPTVLTGNTVSLRAGRKMNQAVAEWMDTRGTIISKTFIGKMMAGQTISFSAGNGVMTKGIYFIRVTDSNELVDTKRIVVN